MRVFINRGISGCGKTTWAKTNHPNAPTFSADKFHIDKLTGEYKYDASKANAAHNWCLKNYANALYENKHDVIIVDNTNCRVFEIAPYYRLAEANYFPVFIVQFLCDPELAIKRTTHFVPPDVIRQMARNFEPVPPWWNVQYITVT